jgi:uncharacterized protein YbbC (DUF1343 family)
MRVCCSPGYLVSLPEGHRFQRPSRLCTRFCLNEGLWDQRRLWSLGPRWDIGRIRVLQILLFILGFTIQLWPNADQVTVLTGIDVLEAENFARLAGLRVGLITNQTGLSRSNRSTIDLFRQAPSLRLIKLFSPEHGLFGNLDRKVDSFVDERTGLMVHSLYGQHRRPTPEMMEGLDVLVFDIQDIGARFYTYISTMGYAMEEAAKSGIRFVVLDRPNPINGLQVEGPILEAQHLSFTGYFPLPIRHGMTVGELALLFNAENNLGVNLEVVTMEGWQRQLWLDQTNLGWVNPSPNIRNLRQATLYTAVGLLESTNVSVGRGTEMPFEILGAPWINAARLARHLNSLKLAGVKMTPIHFTPSSDRYQGKRCNGIKLSVTDRGRFETVRCGLEIARALARMYPRQFQSDKLVNMVGSEVVVKGIQRAATVQELMKKDEEAFRRFVKMREKYLLYP